MPSPDHTPRRQVLPNGQAVEYRQYGDPAEEPVFFFHGWPAESHQGCFLHEAAAARGLRVISPNRPGIGASSRQPGRRFPDWPPVVAGLADALGISTFRILGLSGGGPYALACAWALPGRVRKVATVCGAIPAAPGQDRRGLSPVYQGMLAIHDSAPWLLKSALLPVTRAARIPPPRPLLWLLLRTLGPRDRLALMDRARFRLYFPGFANAMRSGVRGIWEDGDPYSSPWGFAVEEIRVPVSVWHGTQDRNFHHTRAEALAASIPGASFHRVEEGHYSILPMRMEEILADLVDGEP